jgi:hypothetical protein
MNQDGSWTHAYGNRPTNLSDVDVCYTNGLERHFPWLAGRWMVWDDYCRSHGIYPKYYCGEGGALTTPGDCGPGVLGGRPGWREAGEWEPYIMDQLKHLTWWYQQWNEQFGWRFFGLDYFTNKWWGWDNHWVLDGEIRVWTNTDWRS